MKVTVPQIKVSKFQALGTVATLVGAVASVVGQLVEKRQRDEELGKLVEEAMKARGL